VWVVNEALASFAGLPIAARIAISLLILVQLTMQVFCLFDLTRRERVAGFPKWGWALVIVLGELIGPILYLAIGRKTPVMAEDPMRAASAPPATADRAEHAADVLYGDRTPR
jgi:hypothetical protein